MTRPRGPAPSQRNRVINVGLPVRPFLYTLDQIATILSIDEQGLKSGYVYFEGRSTGVRSLHLLLARNIAGPRSNPDWRVAEEELLRWMKLKGFRAYHLGVVTH